MTIAETLASRIAGVTWDSLPDDARHWAEVAILDAVGRTLAGANEPCAHANRPDPRGALDAKFNVRYCLARAPVSRAEPIAHFEDCSSDRPAVRAVLRRFVSSACRTGRWICRNISVPTSR